MTSRQPKPAPGPDAAPALRAEGVSKTIGPVTLLPETSLTVAPGTALVLRGPNGAGKTTLLKILAGTLDPSTGSATIDDRPADERDRVIRGQVAALIGAPTAYRDLTLADHLTLIDATWGRDPDTCDERVDAGLAALEIGHLHDRFPHELSSGQSQLFRLALTFFRPATVLILDEPEQRLDTEKRTLVADLLVARKRAGTTMVIACHDPAMTQTVADKVIDVGGPPDA